MNAALRAAPARHKAFFILLETFPRSILMPAATHVSSLIWQ
jgi:hypothetical protein